MLIVNKSWKIGLPWEIVWHRLPHKYQWNCVGDNRKSDVFLLFSTEYGELLLCSAAKRGELIYLAFVSLLSHERRSSISTWWSHFRSCRRKLVSMSNLFRRLYVHFQQMNSICWIVLPRRVLFGVIFAFQWVNRTTQKIAEHAMTSGSESDSDRMISSMRYDKKACLNV